VFALSLAACSSGNGSGNDSGHDSGNDSGNVSGNGSALDSQLEALPVADLTDTELAGLAQMREEEKLAHDVYVALFAQWQVQVFDNISAAELTHADAVKALLDRYGLDDPASGNAEGVFTSPDMQTLYDSLVAQGSESLVAALTVGATVEDLDIADLRSLSTDAPDIALVYANLEKGSRNHLRAFTKQLVKQGADYTPAYITQADYDAIIAGGMEQGSAG